MKKNWILTLLFILFALNVSAQNIYDFMVKDGGGEDVSQNDVLKELK